MLGSYDGDNHFIVAAPNAQCRLVVDMEGGILAGGISSFGKLRRYLRPRTLTARPLIVTPAASSNRQISTLTQNEAPSTGNSWTTVDPDTELGVANSLSTGRVIPKPPCNGPVRRWTFDGSTVGASSKYGGVYTLTTGTPIPAAPSQAHYKVRLWVCMMPVSTPYGGDNVAPYNSPRTAFRVQLLRAGSAQSSFLAAGDVDSMDGMGWVPVVIEGSTTQWASYVTAASNLAMRFTNPGDSLTNMDVLIAFDQVVIETDAPTDLCAHPAPVGASASTMGNEQCSLSLPIRNGVDWTSLMVAQIPEGTYDQFMSIARRPTNPRLFTMSGDTSDLAAYFNFTNRQLVLENGASTSISANAGEEFCFMPGDPVLIALSKTGTTLTYAVSLGGSTVVTGTDTTPSGFHPHTLYMADASHPIAALKWYKVQTDINRAYSAAELTTALQNLNL